MADDKRDLNEYGRFENFYEARPVRPSAPEVQPALPPRREASPFLLEDFRGTNAYQKPTT
jgi:hypothetical protein